MTKKRFNVFAVDGTVFLEDHKEGSYHIGEIENVDVNCLNDIAHKLNELAEENEELKQFKEQVYNLIDKKLEENKELDSVDTAMYYANKETLNELKKELRK